MSTSPAALLPPPTTADDEVRARLDEFGVAVVPDMLTGAEVAAVRRRLVEQLAGERAAGLGPRPAHSDGSGAVHYTVGVVSKGQVSRGLSVPPAAAACRPHGPGAGP